MGWFGKGKGTALGVGIEGMTCDHCARRVQDGLEALAGVSGAKVELGKKRAQVRIDPSGSSEQATEMKEAIRRKIEELGYKVVGID